MLQLTYRQHDSSRCAPLVLCVALISLVTWAAHYFASQQATAKGLLVPMGTVVSGPSTAISRREHTATLLGDGRVLVVGGRSLNDAQALDSTEIYDPAKNQWSAAAALRRRRYQHAALLLQNGEVLVSGGQDSGAPLDSAEVYDPISNTWRPAPVLRSARYGHTMTLLPDGRVLATGGAGINGVLRAAETVDCFGVTCGQWVASGEMKTGRQFHAAVILPNGQVLVAGGATNHLILNSAELYDPATKTWRLTSAMTAARLSYTLTLLGDGQVLAAGSGFSGTGADNGTELFNPRTQRWTRTTGGLNVRRELHTATLLPNGRVLVAGGVGNNFEARVELYDPATRSWSLFTSLREARAGGTATLLASGRILFVGGSNSTPALQSTELYEVADPLWRTTRDSANQQTTMFDFRYAHTSTLLADGQVLVTGGVGVRSNVLASIDTVELYNPTTKRWQSSFTNLPAPMRVSRAYHTATLLPDGKVLVAGGLSGGVYLNTAEIFNPVTQQWSLTLNAMAVARAFHTATLLPNGKVLIAGGRSSTVVYNTGDIYDPATNRWETSSVVVMPSARREHTATLLSDGKVLFTGGRGGSNVLNTASLFDPTSRVVTTVTPTMSAPRFTHTATLLPDGKVLIVGGLASATETLKTSELYDPLTRTWSPPRDLQIARQYHTATLLLNGKVLAAGGFGVGDIPPDDAELYDPVTGQWALTGGTLTLGGRGWHAASLLLDGQVLIVGGLRGIPTINTIRRDGELYDPGSGFEERTRPTLLTGVWRLAGEFIFGGARFTGVSEATGGGNQSSPSNHAVALLRSLGNEQVRFLSVDTTFPSTLSDTGFKSGFTGEFAPGLAAVTIIANGVPSRARTIGLGGSFDGTELASISGRITDRKGRGFAATLLLSSDADAALPSVTTDSKGFYSLTNLPVNRLFCSETCSMRPINYTLSIQPQSGITFSPPCATFPAGGGGTPTNPNQCSRASATGGGANDFTFNSLASGAAFSLGGFIRCPSGLSGSFSVTLLTFGDQVPALACGQMYTFTELPDGETYEVMATERDKRYIFNPRDLQSFTLTGRSKLDLDFGAQAGNPAPQPSTLLPSTIRAGGDTFDLIISGAGFNADSRVYWNNSARETALSGNTLRAEILAKDIATPGTANVTVVNPTPGGGTSPVMRFTVTASVSPPDVTTEPATGMMATTAILNGTLNPKGVETSYYFELGTDASLAGANRTGTRSAGAGTATQTVNEAINGLMPGQTYYFRLVAANAGGVSEGATRSFTTPVLCPTISNLTPTSAAIGETLTINGANFGGVTSVRFTGNVSAAFTRDGDTKLLVSIPNGAASGPITLGKAGCADVATLTFNLAPVCGTRGELRVDDDSRESTLGFEDGVNAFYFVNRLKPSAYPATLQSVSLSLVGLPAGYPIIVLAAANPGGGDQIDGLTFQRTTAVVRSESVELYPVSPLNLTSGDFVVGVVLDIPPNKYPMASDTDSPKQRRSYYSYSGTTFSLFEDHNFFIRAQLQQPSQNCGADLSLTKMHTGNFTPGSNGFYSLTVRNEGPGMTSGMITVTDALPAGLSFVSAAGSGWNCGLTGQNVVCTNAGPLASGASSAITLTVAVSSTAAASVTNTATVTVANDSNLINNTASDPTTICRYTISPSGQSFTAAGGSGSIAVTVAGGCAWTAASGAAWINIVGNANGSGNGALNYSVSANTGPARTGTLTVAGQTFIITQASGCTFSISPTTQTIAAAGGPGSVTVTAAAGCSWTATSNANWITINNGASGNGNGTVNYAVTANTGPQRSGTLTVANQTFTVMQASGCTYSISPNSQSFQAAGGAALLTVTSVTGCTWTAASNDSWITINSGAQGSGAGAVNYFVAANTGPQRTGTMTAAGQTFTVTQAAVPPPTISLSPASFNLAVGRAQSFTVSLSAAQTTTTIIALTSSNTTMATVPANVSVPANATSASFNVTGVGVGGPVTITASLPAGLGGGSATASVRVSFIVTVRIGTASAAAGGLASVPIEMGSLGNVNSLAFSINFDPAVLRNPQAVLGSGASGASLNVYASQAAQGRLGLTLALPGNQTFAAGTRQIVTVAFTIAAGVTAASSGISFGSQPIPQEVADGAVNPLLAEFQPGAVTIAQGVEADVSPRPNGDGAVTFTDSLLMGRFIAGEITPAAGSEFQRADCAPRDTAGNGRLTVSDLIQAGRYVELDSPAPAGGPTAPVSGFGFADLDFVGDLLKRVHWPDARTLRLRTGGENFSLLLELDAFGGESAAGVSLNFDPLRWRWLSASLDADANSATLLLNRTQLKSGRLGIVVALPPGQTLPSGKHRLVTLRFSPLNDKADSAAFSFGDAPVSRELVNAEAESLPMNFAREDERPLTVVSAADFQEQRLARESIAVAFATPLASVESLADGRQVPVWFAGAQVVIVDSKGGEHFAPLLSVLPDRITFLLPVEAALGYASVLVRNQVGQTFLTTAEIVETAPAIFGIRSEGQRLPAATLLRVHSDGRLSYDPVSFFDTSLKRQSFLPIQFGEDEEQLVLVLFGTGLRHHQGRLSARIGLSDLPVLFAGAQGEMIGLDQINLALPRTLAGGGEVTLEMTLNGQPAGSVRLVFK